MAKQILGKVQGPAGFSPKVELDKTDDTLTITVQNEDGVSSESIKTGEPVQSNWSVTDPNSLAFIANKPTISKTGLTNSYSDLDDKPSKLSQFTNDSGYITVAAVPTQLSQLTGDTTHRVVTDTEKAEWSGKMDGTVTHLTGDVPTSRTVNGKALNADITLSAADVGAMDAGVSIPEVSDTYSSLSGSAMSGKAVAQAIANLVNSAPSTLDTLGEIAEALDKDKEGSIVNSIMTILGEKLNATATAADSSKLGGKLPSAYAEADHTHNYAEDKVMTGASEESNGTKGLVPAPAAGMQNKFLRADGIWAEASGGANMVFLSQSSYNNTSGVGSDNVLYFVN